MNDRELLELAAKAAGLSHPDGFDWIKNEMGYPWNPLTDDGDALRLAVKLKMAIDVEFDRVDANGMFDFCDGSATEFIYDLPTPTDVYAATRRAIVRAAAEIGRAMP